MMKFTQPQICIISNHHLNKDKSQRLQMKVRISSKIAVI